MKREALFNKQMDIFLSSSMMVVYGPINMKLPSEVHMLAMVYSMLNDESEFLSEFSDMQIVMGYRKIEGEDEPVKHIWMSLNGHISDVSGATQIYKSTYPKNYTRFKYAECISIPLSTYTERMNYVLQENDLYGSTIERGYHKKPECFNIPLTEDEMRIFERKEKRILGTMKVVRSLDEYRKSAAN